MSNSVDARARADGAKSSQTRGHPRHKLVQSAAAIEGGALLAVLMLTGIRALLGQDLSFHDETAYLTRGLAISSGEFPSFQNGATYSDLYFLLSTYVQDNTNLYLLMRWVSATAFVGGLWLASRLLAGPTLAFVAAAFACLLDLTYAWPGVAGPASGLVLVATAMVIRRPSATGFGVGAGLLWLAAGSRPELSLFAFLTSLLALASIARILTRGNLGAKPNGTVLRGIVSVLIGAIAVPVLLVYLHGSPWSTDSRSWTAFSQHFSLRHFLPGEDPWLSADKIIERYFGGASSIPGALAASPLDFFQHISANVMSFPKDMVTGLGGGTENPIALSTVAFAILIALLLAAVVTGSERRPRVRESPWKLTPISTTWVCILVISLLIPVLLIFPRQHYLVALVGLLILAVVVSLNRYSTDGFWTGLASYLALGALVIQTVLSLVGLIASMQTPPPLLSAAKELTTLTTTTLSRDEMNLLAIDWGLTAYVPNLRQIDESSGPSTNISLVQWMEEQSIDVVLMNDRLRASSFAEMDGFSAFAADPTAFGFRPLASGSNLWFKAAKD